MGTSGSRFAIKLQSSIKIAIFLINGSAVSLKTIVYCLLLLKFFSGRKPAPGALDRVSIIFLMDDTHHLS